MGRRTIGVDVGPAGQRACRMGRVDTIPCRRGKALHSLCVWVALSLLAVACAPRLARAQTTGAGSTPSSSVGSAQAGATGGGAPGPSTAGSVTNGPTSAPRTTGGGGQEDDLESRPLKQAVAGGAAREDRGGGLFMDVLGKLAMVVALIFACAAIWRKFQGAQPQGGATSSMGLQLVTTLPLGAQRHVHVVAVGRRHYLIGSAPQGVTLLAALDEQPVGLGGRGAAAAGYGGAGSGLHDPRAEPGVDDGWADAASDGGDRFEELLLRLRRLEAEQASHGRPGAGAIDDDPYRGRGGTPARDALPERRSPASRDGRRNDEGTADGRALAPGELFRSSSEGPRGGRYA